MKNIVAFTGAGISKESGINTFRDSKDGLWQNHDVEEIATVNGWRKNPMLMTEFYNERRRQLKDVFSNDAHKALAELESKYNVNIISQNVDDLHERGGSTKIIHLHGELKKVRCQGDEDGEHAIFWNKDVTENDVCSCHNAIYRPHVVWFGESVNDYFAEKIIKNADIFFIVGTSFNISYTIHLVQQCKKDCEIYYIDPEPVDWIFGKHVNVTYIKEPATVGVRSVVDKLMKI